MKLKTLMVSLSVIAASPVMAIPIWINEFHYDNAGTDANEFVEIAGPAGTLLSAYSLVLYNGANGQSYNTLGLSGSIPNQQNGFGTLSFSYPVDGIQNGSPDGIALYDGSSVFQFLGYEGIFTATNGVANGMTSTDVGVAESATTPVGSSLQLIGAGSRYEDFSWSSPSTASPGAVNANQTFGVPEGGSTFLLLGLTAIALPLFKRKAAREDGAEALRDSGRGSMRAPQHRSEKPMTDDRWPTTDDRWQKQMTDDRRRTSDVGL